MAENDINNDIKFDTNPDSKSNSDSNLNVDVNVDSAHPDTPRPSPEPAFCMRLADVESVVRQTTYTDAEAAEHLAAHNGNVLATITTFMGHTYAPKLGEFDKRPKQKVLSGIEIQKEAHRQMRQCHYDTYDYSTERAAATAASKSNPK